MSGAHPLSSWKMAVLVSVIGTGCRSCSGLATDESVPIEVVQTSDLREYTRAVKLQNLVYTSNAVVLRAGSRVWIWVDGRASALSLPLDAVRWSPAGFELATLSGFSKVLAPGGSLYYRVAAGGQADSRPLEELLGKPSAPPVGFGIDYVDGAGGSRVQAILTGPEGRRVRLGLFERVPDEQVWLRGEVSIDGEKSSELDEGVGFAKGAGGMLRHAIPSKAESLAWDSVRDTDLKEWMAAVQPFSKDGSPLTVGCAVAADLDRDGLQEAIVCLDGPIRMLDPRCVLVDVVDDETRMFGLSLPWTAGGSEPLAFTVNGAPYVMMVSDEDPQRGFVVRTFGAGWVVDPIQ